MEAKMKRLLTCILAFFVAIVVADTPELKPYCTQADQYELIFKCNPLTWDADGYEVDRSECIEGKLTKVAFFLKLTDKNDKTTWALVEFDPFTQNLIDLGIPTQGGPTFHQKIANLVVASNVPSIKTGNFPEGNIEFWPLNYGPNRTLNLPEGRSDVFDFDDTPSSNGNYTSMQIHNFLEKQTIIAINKPSHQICEVGIGNNTDIAPKNNPNAKPNPDWTFTDSEELYKSGELIVAGKFDNPTIKPFVPLDTKNVFLKGYTDKEQATDYKVGETIVFSLQPEFGNQQPTGDFFIVWSRTGDDGVKMEGREKVVHGKPLVIETSLSKPGFIRIQATLRNKNNRVITKKGLQGEQARVFFDGGAGAEIEKLQGLPEPEDFDAFWAKQRTRLAEVPLKPELTPMPSDNPNLKVFAVSIPCPGPDNRPTTGFLTIPVDAKPKSLPAHAHFHGYGTSIQRAPRRGSTNSINFNVNAHGYDLNKDEQYYKDFFESIRSNGHGYAFDPKQNADPEKAYFNGMALRLMRAFEFLKSLPEWDGKTLCSHGGSQGGLQCVWAGALEPQLTQTNPGIPWCADLGGKTVGRIAGGWNIPYVPAIDYYDCVNMAKRIPATCFVNITRAGLGDYVCPPSGIAMIYNNVKGPKRIFWVQGSTHGYVPPSPNQTYVITNQDAEVK